MDEDWGCTWILIIGALLVWGAYKGTQTERIGNTLNWVNDGVAGSIIEKHFGGSRKVEDVLSIETTEEGWRKVIYEYIEIPADSKGITAEKRRARANIVKCFDGLRHADFDIDLYLEMKDVPKGKIRTRGDGSRWIDCQGFPVQVLQDKNNYDYTAP